MDRPSVGPEPELAPSLAELLRQRVMDLLADAYGHWYAFRYTPTAATLAELIAARPEWTEDELLKACHELAEASERADNAPPEQPQRPREPQPPVVVTAAVVHQGRTHRAGHRGPTRRPAARRTRRATARAGPDDSDPGEPPAAAAQLTLSYRCARPGCGRLASRITLAPSLWMVEAVTVTCGLHWPRVHRRRGNSWHGGFGFPLARWTDGDAREVLEAWRDEWVSDLVREALAAVLVAEEQR